ncbi:MAG: Asp23/Gls24 family envelope stress response protein [Clostridia bacterium]|nr:Asp23/Gls24 family envelope stress response protein [Clostridia bacterium]
MIAEFENEIGKVMISRDAIAKIAGLTAMECYGVVGMASKNMKEGLVKLLGIETLTRGIEVDIVNNKLKLIIHVMVSYGTNIKATGESIMNTVKYKVEQLSGIEVDSVKIMVEGIKA